MLFEQHLWSIVVVITWGLSLRRRPEAGPNATCHGTSDPHSASVGDLRSVLNEVVIHQVRRWNAWPTPRQYAVRMTARRRTSPLPAELALATERKVACASPDNHTFPETKT